MFLKNAVTGMLLVVTFMLSLSVSSQTVYKEAGGILVMEMENSKSLMGKWVKKSDGSGWSGSGFYEFTGNDHNGSGSDRDPQEFRFKIAKAGIYGIHLHAYNRLDGQPADKCNDAYVKVTGDYTSGSNVPLSALTKDTKLYSSNGGNVWAWGFQLDGNGADHVAAKYNFKSGEEYLLTISGRSIRFQIDRILFAHNDVDLNSAKAAPESDTVGATPINNDQPFSKKIETESYITYTNGLLRFNNLQSGTYSVMLTALNGRTILETPLRVAENDRNTASINFDRIVNGAYITRIEGNGLSEKKVIFVNK
ncbi:hypothetical protein ACFL5S_00655 [Fibrobacterota bacterium]